MALLQSSTRAGTHGETHTGTITGTLPRCCTGAQAGTCPLCCTGILTWTQSLAEPDMDLCIDMDIDVGSGSPTDSDMDLDWIVAWLLEMLLWTWTFGLDETWVLMLIVKPGGGRTTTSKPDDRGVTSSPNLATRGTRAGASLLATGGSSGKTALQILFATLPSR